MKSKITVKVYGTTTEYASREEAEAFYREGMEYCDPRSSEYSRYAFICEALECEATSIDADRLETY